MRTKTEPGRTSGLPVEKSAVSTTHCLPSRLRIHLESEDVDAWDRSARGTGWKGGKYATDILRRTAAKPLDSQPEIYEMPQCAGREWPGDIRSVPIDEPLARAVVSIAAELGVPVETWAYSAIIAETLGFREKPVTALRQPRATGGPVPCGSADTRSIIIQVSATLANEVEGLLKSSAGITLFGPETIGERLSSVAESWMKNLTFALPEGSGRRDAMKLESEGGAP